MSLTFWNPYQRAYEVQIYKNNGVIVRTEEEELLENGLIVPSSKYFVSGFVVDTLAEYENTGLTPQEIEQMKARMPLHLWAGESPDKMSIFGVPVSRIIELTKADKQGRIQIKF